MEVKPGYKQTEIGVIPEDWVCGSLESMSAFITKGSTPTTYGYKWEQSGILFLRSECVSAKGLDLTQSMFISPAAHASLRRSEVCDSDILVTITGNVGRVVYLSGVGCANLNQHIARVRVTSAQVDRKYVYHFLSQAAVRKNFNTITTGQAYPQISLKQVREAVVSLPPTKAEQEAIAEALSDADALIEALEQLLVKKRYLKQGAMQELLTGKRRLPAFSGKWNVKRLGETAILKARIGWQGLTTAEYLDTGDYSLVTGTEFKNGYIDWNSCHYVDESRYKQDKYIQLKAHDVLVTKDGTIGKVAIITDLPRPATLNSGVFVIRPIEDAFHPEFFYYLLCSNVFTEFLVQLSAGSTINHLYQKDFVNFFYRKPPTIKEQTVIATILSDMDAEIAALEEKLAKARQIKQGMMQELLTGWIRLVRPVSNVIPFPPKKESTSTLTKSHNWQINEAVIIAVLAKHFGSEQWPLARKRCTKLTYLLHRYAEHKAEGYLKKAAGPYNPDTRYKGPEAIAQKNHYVGIHHNGNYDGFVAADNIAEAESYFEKWYGPDVLVWLERFRFEKTVELELLTTVDFTLVELCRDGKAIKLDTVKKVIRDDPEWKAKLDREVFCDSNINRAIQSCRELFVD